MEETNHHDEIDESDDIQLHKVKEYSQEDESHIEDKTLQGMKERHSQHLERLGENLRKSTEKKHGHKYFELHEYIHNIKHFLKVHVYMYEEIEPKGKFQHFQWEIAKFIESKYVQFFLIFLLCLDVSFLMLEFIFDEAYRGTVIPHSFEIIENVLKMSTLIILVIFEIEMFCLIFAYTWRFFFHPFYVLDLLVVTAAIILEVVLRSIVVALVPSVFRVWRFFRALEAISLAEKEYLHDNSIGISDCEQFSKILVTNKSIEHLNLGYNKLGPEGCKIICNSLKENKTLKILELQTNSIKDEGCKHISILLSKNTTIESLNLDFNSLSVEGIIILSDCLAKNNHLKELSLGYNFMNLESCIFLSEMLGKNNSITTLDLRWNRIKNEGCVYLSENLYQNHTLTSLNLSDNKINNSGAKHFYNLIMINHTLIDLNIQDNIVTKSMGSKIGKLDCNFKSKSKLSNIFEIKSLKHVSLSNYDVREQFPNLEGFFETLGKQKRVETLEYFCRGDILTNELKLCHNLKNIKCLKFNPSFNDLQALKSFVKNNTVIEELNMRPSEKGEFDFPIEELLEYFPQNLTNFSVFIPSYNWADKLLNFQHFINLSIKYCNHFEDDYSEQIIQNTILKSLEIYSLSCSPIELFKSVQLNNSIEEFIFSGTKMMEPNVLESFFEMIQKNKNLTSIGVFSISNKNKNVSWADFFKCIGQTSNIVEFSVADMIDGYDLLIEMFEQFNGNTSIRKLNLQTSKYCEIPMKNCLDFVMSSTSIVEINFKNLYHDTGILCNENRRIELEYHKLIQRELKNRRYFETHFTTNFVNIKQCFDIKFVFL
eukprot:gene5566-9384_t